MGTSQEPTGKPFPGYDFDTFDGCVAAVGDEPSIEDPEGFCRWLDEEGKEALSDPNADEVLATVGVEFVSAVDEPAQDSEWLIAKDAEGPDGERHRWKSEATLYVRKGTSKDDDVKQVAFAPVLIPKEADKQGDVIPAPAIEDAAHTYLAEYRKVDSDHDLRDGKGTPVESWTLKQDTTFEMPDGGDSRVYPEGTWVMGIKFDDETWKRVTSGELNGLSIYGGAKPVDVDALLGKGITTDVDDDVEVDKSSENMADEPDPDEPGNDGEEQTSKQELGADQVSAMLAEFASMVEDGGLSPGATVEDFVRSLIDSGSIDETQVTGLSVFLNGGGGGDEAPDEGDGMGEDEGDEEMSTDDGVELDADGDGGDDGDVDKSDGEGDTEDVGKSVDGDGGDVFDDAPEWAQALKSEVDDLREQVEDPPRADRMESGDELSDRIAKDLTGKDDPDVARKAIREQVEKSDGDDGPSVSYDGITDGEGADASASDESGGSLHSAAANRRMTGGDN